MIFIELDDSIKVVDGVGKLREINLNKNNIFTVKDLIEYFPKDYKDRRSISLISDLEENQTFSIKGFIIKDFQNYKLKNITITKTCVKDSTGTISCIWYNQPYMKNNFKIGQEYIFVGKIKNKYNNFEMECIDYEIYDENSLSTTKIVPVYSSIEGISQKIFRKIINISINEVKHDIVDFMPINILEKFKLCSRQFAIENIHFPSSSEDFFKARRRLVFDEIFIMQLMLLKLKNLKKVNSNIHLNKFDLKEIMEKITFTLTFDQENCIDEIIKDLKSGFSMNRLIQGDVGSGKTIVAVIISYLILQNNFQVVIMVPTEVLAKQHFESINKFFEPKYKVGLITGSTKKKEKEQMYNDIFNGTLNLVIGTHALIQDKVKFKNLALIVTDEQHRFGVKQRETLINKGDNPHILLMTATPIPRTLAITIYGDMSISTIKEMPKGRKTIKTYSVTTKYRTRIYNFIKEEIKKGRQAYIICPMIDENEDMDLEAVVKYTEGLKGEFLNYEIDYLHGKMKPIEKEEIMNKFANKKLDVIVATSVIEVGINVPNATVIVIENAERFGLSQLHQLRGRVGRGEYSSYCILVSNAKSKISKKRMEALVSSNDGFELSELDLKLRGTGDFFGTNQHGLPNFKIANLYNDIKIVEEVHEAIKFLDLNNDVDNYDMKKFKNEIDNFLIKFNTITL